MTLWVPSWEYFNEERAWECTKESTYGNTAIEKSFSSAGIDLEADEVEDHINVELSKIGDRVSEVERAQGNVEHDESYLEFGSVGDSRARGKKLVGLAVHSIIIKPASLLLIW